MPYLGITAPHAVPGTWLAQRKYLRMEGGSGLGGFSFLSHSLFYRNFLIASNPPCILLEKEKFLL